MDTNDGPKIRKTFTCEGCKWLFSAYGDKKNCLHPDITSSYTDTEFVYKIFVGTIHHDLQTPLFCPYLIKKLRQEKLKELK